MYTYIRIYINNVQYIYTHIYTYTYIQLILLMELFLSACLAGEGEDSLQTLANGRLICLVLCGAGGTGLSAETREDSEQSQKHTPCRWKTGREIYNITHTIRA